MHDRRMAVPPTPRKAEPAQAALAPAEPDSTLGRVAFGTRWGMTVEELLAALPSAKRNSGLAESGERGLFAQARADRRELRGRTFRAEFLFDRSGRLEAIRLRATPETPGNVVYDNLAMALTSELGEPAAVQTGDPSTGTWEGRSSWVTSRAVVDLEARKLGASAAPVLSVDIRGGTIRPLNDSEVVLTVASPHEARTDPASNR